MAIIKVESKNQAGIDRKPRVYFTCHPADFENCFHKICDDVFATHDCAVYYTPDMTEVIAAEDRETDLGRHNLFVVPVTLKLLTTPNRAMDVDIPYARQSHIPVLPFMMEPGLDVIYSLPNKFGELQYLNPNSSDFTEISYCEKLKKYLDSVLIGDELANRIRAAFDAYIFLSYRKKDRRHANELMRLIHSIPGCRDIAIWFDEFLTPGESFRESIDRILRDSQLFALLVTPNLLEDQNFVMREEYPAAQRVGIPILPTEMEATDRDELSEKYPNIPDCIQTSDEAFRSRLLETVKKLATEENDIPEHNYLIGLAYLFGIDVEVNHQHALELIDGAAEKELPEAMEKLYEMYRDGIGVALDYRKAVVWAQKLADYRVVHLGQEHPSTLTSLNNLASTYGHLGDYRRALELLEKVYDLQCKVLGPEHPDTLTSLNNLASTYGELCDHRRALELKEKEYDLSCKVLGLEHPSTLTSLNNLASTYGHLGDYRRALELQEKVYDVQCKVLGQGHPSTLTSLNNLAFTYGELGDHRRALELREKVYDLRGKVLGCEHPSTLEALNNLATTYGELGQHRRELKLEKKVYDLHCKVLGPEHPNTLTSLNNLATTFYDLGKHRRALELQQKVYNLRCKALGPEHLSTLTSLNNLAGIYSQLGDHRRALLLLEKVYDLSCKVLGTEHPSTLRFMNNLAVAFYDLGDYQKSLNLIQQAYELRCVILGEDHPETAITRKNMDEVKRKFSSEKKRFPFPFKLIKRKKE